MKYQPRLHGKRWRVRWRQDGKVLQRSFGTRIEADQFAARLEDSLDAHRATLARRRSPLSISEAVDSYYARRKRRLQPSTQHHYEQLVAKHIVPKIGSLLARAVAETPALLQDFYDELPPTTALHCHQILRPALQYAVDHRLIDRNPCSVAKPPRKKRPERLIPSAEEVAKIVLAAREQDPVFGLFVWLVSRLGLRRGEACALRWEDFRPDRLEIYIRRTIARRHGGTFLKAPKSGEARTIRMDPRFFGRLNPLRRESGWLFPRAYNCPYRFEGGIASQSTAGRFLAILSEGGGTLVSPSGRAGIDAAKLLSLGPQSALPMLRWLEREGIIEREGNRSRTYAIHLTEAGRSAYKPLAEADRLPWFPTTADQKFRHLMRQLDLPYTLHSLRHFVATHLYNRNRDWVQLARFLGHSSPAITMNLYANHVIEPSQLALGEAAMELFDDPTI